MIVGLPGKSRGVHPGNAGKQNPFCGIAITPEGFVCDPLQQFFADMLLDCAFWCLEDVESVITDE